MKAITRELIYLYHPRQIDWMGYELRSITDLTYHHIQKREDGGRLTLDNGALLRGDTAHEYLHIIESKDFPSLRKILFKTNDPIIIGYP